MKEWNWGSSDRRQLCVRFAEPWQFREWDSQPGWKFSWRRLLNPMRWIRAAYGREAWEFWCRRFSGITHRCYCDTGSSFDGRIVVAGWTLIWFYSHYTGDIPCPCDEAYDNEYGDDSLVESSNAE